ncbi:MAG: AI-2E family transporter [Bacteroides sp.]|nr:AI-2E family transporter [Bacteroides sp.]
MLEKKITFDSFIRTLFGIALAIGILALINHLSGVLLPFFLAWFIAYLIYPVVRFFQYKLRLKNRVLAIFCTLLSLLIIGSISFYLFVPPMIQEFAKVKDLLVEYLAGGIQNTAVPASISEFIRENIDLEMLNQYFNEENLTNLVKGVLPKLWVIFSESLSFLISILASFIVLLYIVFILLDYEAIAKGWVRLVPSKYRHFAQNLASDVEYGMSKYFRGQAVVALSVGILFCIGFLIIDFPLAIGLGLLLGLLNMVPYLQIIGFIPTLLLAILKAADTGQNFWIISLGALAVFAIVQIIQDGFIVPKVMGKITGLNPAIILLSLSIWGSLMGIVGMIIALPLTTLMISYYQRFILGHEQIVVEITPQPASKKEKKKKEEKEF